MALATVRSCTIDGVHALPVFVEVHVGGGLPAMSIVGLPESAVRESKDRIRAALTHLGFDFPQVRVTVNLAPADVPKRGGRFDLPIALGVLIATGQLPRDATAGLVVIGELGLTGELRSVPGALPAAIALAEAAAEGRDVSRALLLPSASAREAALERRIDVHAAASLGGACALLRDPSKLAASITRGGGYSAPGNALRGGALPDSQAGRSRFDMADVEGQAQARRVVEIAAAGGHHLLLYGAPGTGKSMLAARLPGLRPPMTTRESMEAASVASVAHRGFSVSSWGLRPFRAPHHTASAIALVGGGAVPMPGEISLAHRGILFLDEIAEFPRAVLDALREPMESGRVTLSRAARQADFPAAFQLVAAMNPCPCGRFGTAGCRCSPTDIDRYQSRLSGPFLDRIDLRLEMGPPADASDGARRTESSDAIRRRTCRAAARQRARQGVENHALSPGMLRQVVRLDRAGESLLADAAARLGFSTRARHRVLRVARTIADLAGSVGVLDAHVAESIAYRGPVAGL